MFSPALRRNACNRSFQDFQECLLHTFAGYVPGNGHILGFFRNFINFIYINNSILRSLNIPVCCLDDLQQDILYILTHISCFCQRSGICNGKRHIQKSCQCLGKQRLTGACWPQHQDIALLQLHIQISGCSHSFIMVVNRYRKCFFRFILSNHIIIQDCMDFLRFQKVDLISESVILIIGSIQLFFYDLRTDSHTFVTDKCTVRTCDQFAHLILGFLAKGTSDFSFSYLLCHEFPIFPF